MATLLRILTLWSRRQAARCALMKFQQRLAISGLWHLLGVNARVTMQGGDRYSPVPEGLTIEEIMERNDKTVPEGMVFCYQDHKIFCS